MVCELYKFLIQEGLSSFEINTLSHHSKKRSEMCFEVA